MNGGYFDPENVPLGLLISDGKLIAPLRKARLLSGVMVATQRADRIASLRRIFAEAKMRRRRCNAGRSWSIGGKPVPGLNDTRSARRTFILTGGADRGAARVFCSSVTLAQLGRNSGDAGHRAGPESAARAQSRWRIVERVLVRWRTRAVLDFASRRQCGISWRWCRSRAR